MYKCMERHGICVAEEIRKEKEKQRISVRSLVEFILRSGDIDNRHTVSSENAMLEGGRIHRMIQRRMGAEYQAEVSLRYVWPTENYDLILEGRADGVIDENGQITIDEIKGTYRELANMKGPVPVHVAQAKCYAYMYAWEKDVEHVTVRMTYCNMDTEEIRYFTEHCDMSELKVWFLKLVEEYLKWADYRYEWKQIRNASIKAAVFPFAYREGQKELVSYVYQTIYHKRKLFLQAPTGVGKTISTVYPAIKAMERGMGEQIFYLTAKTITRTVAEDTIQLLRDRGVRLKSVILTAKDKICFLEKAECNPDSCPYAKGHFDRINEAMYDMITHEESFCRENIEKYASKYQICPFEFGLDMSLFADAVIGDYNYLFDPHVYLKRFFAGNEGGDYIFLIDEAHNLLERGREMYSASLIKEEFMQLKSALKEEYPAAVLFKRGFAVRMTKQLEKCNKEFLALKRECEDCRIVENMDGLVLEVLKLHALIGEYLEENEEVEVPAKELILDLYFHLNHFLDIYERVDDKYVKYTQLMSDGSFLLKLFCVDPSTNLKECLQKGRSSILFSATFLPIQYYKKLLGGEESDYEVYAKSVFDTEKRKLMIAEDVTSKYTRRSEEEFYSIAKYIFEIVTKRHGNYMVFCPSYQFLQQVYEIFEENFATEEMECLVQGDFMTEEEREIFLNKFQGNFSCDLNENIHMDIEMEEESYLIGFCVLGGIFSEGIDLKEDRLIGAIIVGTGLPQVGYEREILKGYFDARGENGFDFSYRFPGMNKVLQAAGRVIRTSEDIGVIALLDERFLQGSYRMFFPREWEDFEVVNHNNISKKIERFWDSWL